MSPAARTWGRLASAVMAGAVTVGPAPPATAAPAHVAIVIAGDRTSCVLWHAGITGDEVLNAVASVGYRRSDGLVNQIDGIPADKRVLPDYWSYWHNSGSGWVYSSVGASGYLPAAGSVEGWIYSDGNTPPPTVSYAATCGGLDAPPTPTKATSAPPPPTSSAPSGALPRARPTISPPGSSTAAGRSDLSVTGVGSSPAAHTSTQSQRGPGTGRASSEAISASGHTSASGHPSTSGHKSASGDPSGSGLPAGSATGSSSSGAPAALRSAGAGNHGSLTGAAVTAVAMAALGGLAWWRRRRRGAD